MIIAQLTDGTFFVGIEEANVQKLKEGRPMQIRLSKLIKGAPDIIVHYGATLQDVERDLRNGVGIPLPPPSELPPGITSHGEKPCD